MRSLRSMLVLLGALVGLAGPAESQQKLLVGTAVAPFGFTDAKTGQPAGFSVDVMNAIAKDQGLTLEFEVMPAFASLLPALVAKQIDIGAASTAITQERRAMGIEFSRPYSRNTEAMLVAAADAGAYRSVDDLKGEVVGVAAGSIYLAGLKTKTGFKEVRPFTDTAEAVLAVAKGEIKGFLTARPLVVHLQSQGQLQGVRIVETYQPEYPSIGGIAVRKEDTDLLAKIDAGLAKMLADGSLKTIANRWAMTLP